MFPILIRIGPVTLHTYGLLVAVGFLAAYLAGRKDFVAKGHSLQGWESLTWQMLIGGLVGARVFYFALVSPREFLANPLVFFKIWEGGLVFYGGLAGGFGALVLFCRRNQLALLSAMDLLAKPLALGQVFGRLGCFAAGCCFGRPTDSSCGVTFTHPESLAPTFVSLHPTQLYESAGNALIFFLLVWLGRLNPRPGILTGAYFSAYGFLRFIVEMFRDDYRGLFWGGLSPSQWGSLFLIAVGLFLSLRSLRGSHV